MRAATVSKSVVLGGDPDPRFTYRFENFFHPFVGELIAKLNRDSLPGMLDATWQAEPEQVRPGLLPRALHPTDSDTVKVVSFPKEIDVAEHGPYANYNWELFFHIPLTIAVHLSKNQRFAEAQRWFHYIFDPTSNDHERGPAEAVLEIPRLPAGQGPDADRRAPSAIERSRATDPTVRPRRF